MSVLMGIFVGYGYVLNKAGPFGLWTWVIVGVGQLLVALIFAEMAGRVPLTGSLYNWNSKLGSSGVAWLVGWFVIFAYTIAVPGIIGIMIVPLQTLLGIEFQASTVNLIAIGIVVASLLINVYGIRLAAYINKLAVVLELVALVVFGSLLAFFLGGNGAHPEFLTTIPQTPVPYLPAFLACILLAAFTIFGFESSADLSEETVQAKRIVPRSIISSVLVSVILGFLFIVLLTLAIPDLGAVTASADPISTILTYTFGALATNAFLICVLIAMFAVILVNTMLASRILFAMARDGRFIAAPFFQKISPRKVPANALLILALIEIIVFFLFSGLIALYATPVILLFIAYLITVVNFTRKSGEFSPTTTFSLGAWRWPVAVLAALWLITAIGILTIPEEFNFSAQIAGGVILFGILQYWFIKYFLKPANI